MKCYSDLAPFSIRLEKPGFSTKNLGFQVRVVARNPVSDSGARCEFKFISSPI
jgi:hypothetical protein